MVTTALIDEAARFVNKSFRNVQSIGSAIATFPRNVFVFITE